MEIDKYKIKGEKDETGMTAKFDNRRVTVIKEKKEYYFEFRIMSKKDEPRACSVNIHGCQITNFKLSKEASEIVLIMLTELMDFKIIK